MVSRDVSDFGAQEEEQFANTVERLAHSPAK